MSDNDKSKYEIYAERLKNRPLKIEAHEEQEEYLIVRIKDNHYALHVRELVKVIDETEYLFYPHFPEPVIGIIYDEGDVINIFDISNILSGKKNTQMYKNFVLVEEGIGFGIDDILDMQSISPDAMQETLMTSSAEEHEFFKGILLNKFPILNLKKVIEYVKIKMSGRG